MAKQKQPDAPATAGLHPSQKFRPMRMARTALVECAYNPRFITPKQQQKLKGILQKLGLLNALVWNERSGTLVSGHQRLKILDALANGAQDYELDIDVVDLTPKQEREAIIALNNPEAMANYDLAKLEAMVGEKDPTKAIDIEAAGYSLADVYQLFGTDPLRSDQLSNLTEMSEQARKLQEAYNAALEKGEAASDFYRVVVFRDYREANAFDDALGFDQGNRYIDGRMLQRLLLANVEAAKVAQAAEGGSDRKAAP